MSGLVVDWQLYLAFLSALAFGFWQGKRYSRHKTKATHSLNQQYFQGLNFLLNEEPDAAIDTFISVLEVNSDTLDTHLALANLLRKRGEVDRAIRIHQNLLARPGLSKEQSEYAQYELALDYTKAGLFDRAEGLLADLIKEPGLFQLKGQVLLLDVYRDEKEWEQGLTVLQSLSGSRFSKTYEKWAPVRAHFCCELADLALSKNEFDHCRKWLKQALNYDKQSARAIILMGKLEIACGRIKQGIQQLKKIVDQNPDYISEAIPYIADGYKAIERPEQYRDFLLTILKTLDNPIILSELADVVASLDGNAAAVAFIVEQVKVNPSGLGLNKLLEYYLVQADEKTKKNIEPLKTVIQRILLKSPQYQCRQCGFKGQKLHWLCPSCKQWGVVSPIQHVGDEL